MAITEESRHRLFQRLEEVLGPEQAAVLMEHLPPVGWADVATKRDVDALAVATKRDVEALAIAIKHEIDAVGDRVRADLAGLETKFERALHQQTWRVLGGVSSIVGVLAIAGRLLA